MSEWSNLPNAAHIDRVLAHAKANPTKWNAAWKAAWDAVGGTDWDATWDATWGAAWVAAWDAAWDEARGAARDAARDEAWDEARGAARGAARGTCAALIAWDEAGDLLSAPVATVRFLAQEGVHAAVLLLPAVIAMEESLDTVK